MATKRMAPAAPKKQADMTIDATNNQTVRQAKVGMVVSPLLNAAIVQRQIVGKRVAGFEPSLTEVHAALADSFRPVVRSNDMSSVETMLLSQANTCDLLFNDLALKARACDTVQKMEVYMRLALKAQQQSAATLRVLGEIKTPKQIAFIKQQNNANGPQQVNNGTGTPPASETVEANLRPKVRVCETTALPEPRPHEEIGNQSNQLLERQHGERMDTRAASTSGRGDQAVATLETIDGTAHRSRKGRSIKQRAKARA